MTSVSDEETSATENETAKVLSSGSSDSSSSSTSTELCDEPDRLSDFDSEEATSLSDASSYIPSQSPHLPSGTSTATPEGFTLMSVSPIKEQPAQEIDYAVPSIRLDIAEDRVSESSSGYSASFSDQKTPLEDSSTDVDFPVVEPISTFVALEQISPEVHHPHACLPPFEDIPFGDIDVASYDNSLSPVISQTNKTELPNAEEVTGTSEYDADMSAIMEINQRLHGIHDRSKVGSGQQDEDVAEVMNDLLSLDQRMNSGRRNSERALKIIQENSEILQRILQCQKRRLSEESSNNVSEEDSVPSSTSAENVTFDVASSTRSQESLISSGERTHSYYRDPTKETTSGEAIDVSPFFSTSRYSHLSGIGSVSEGPVNTPEKSAKSRTPSPEALTRGDYTRDKTLAEVPSFLKDISPFPMSSNTIDENRFLRNRTVSDLTDESSLSLDNCGSKFIALKSPELEPPSKQKDFVSEFLPKEDLVSLTEKFSTERFISEYSTHGKLFGSSLSERNVMEGKTSADLENESSKQSRISKFSDVDDLIRGRVDLEIPDDRFGCSESVGESRGDETSRLYGSGSRFEEFFRFDSAESRPSEAVERTLPHIAKSDSKSDFSHGSRPPSPTVTEMLNRSPSPLDYGFSGRNADHASPPRSPLFRYAASPSRGRERPASLFLTQDSSSFELLDHKGRLSPLYKSLSLLSVNDDKQKPKKKDKSPMRRRTSTDLTSFSFSKIKSPVAISPVKSPSRQRDLGLYPPIKQQGSPSKSPLHFSPFPHRTSTWQPKELGIKLGLYSTDEGSKARKS